MKIVKILSSSILLICLLSCGKHDHKKGNDHGHDHNEEHGHHHGDANHHMHQSSFEELLERFESPDRDAYQQPDSVIAFLGDIDGKKIMDIGAGTGYFSFRLADAGASVIAADVDDQFQKYIGDKKEELGMTDEQIALRKIPYDSPALDSSEVDMVIIVNTYHHIEDRVAYFEQVKRGLKPNGSLVVIDFFKRDLPVGPPIGMKIAATKVSEELKEAGFTSFAMNDSLLEYQFILTAK